MNTPEKGKVYRYENGELHLLNQLFEIKTGSIELSCKSGHIKTIKCGEDSLLTICKEVSLIFIACNSVKSYLVKATTQKKETENYIDFIAKLGNIRFPIITVSDFNLLNYPDSPESSGSDGGVYGLTHAKFLQRLDIDKRISFLDGSIWYRLTSVESILSSRGNCLIELFTYYKKIFDADPLAFSKSATTEYQNVLSRIQEQNYLVHYDGGHSNYVVPFVSHSETVIGDKIKAFFKDVHKVNYLKKAVGEAGLLKWKILIVDDKFFLNTAVKNGDLDKSRFLTIHAHERVTQKPGESRVFVLNQFGNIELHIEGCKTIQDAVTKLSTNKGAFDIIMLDYLLGPLPSYKNDERRDYGHRLIKVFNDIFKGSSYSKEERERFIKGKYGLDNLGFSIIEDNQVPFGRFWIYPISVHNAALLETLKAEGIPFTNPNWHISRGGDPVNTPNLFLYNLLKMMETQVKEVYLDFKSIFCFFQKYHQEIRKYTSSHQPSLHSVSVFDKGSDIQVEQEILHEVSTTSVAGLEKYTRVALNRFVYEFGTFEMLKQDADKGSLLAESMEQINNPDAELLFSRIRKLLYMLAYRNYNHLSELVNSIYAIEELYKKKTNLLQEVVIDFREFRSDIISLINRK